MAIKIVEHSAFARNPRSGGSSPGGTGGSAAGVDSASTEARVARELLLRCLFWLAVPQQVIILLSDKRNSMVIPSGRCPVWRASEELQLGAWQPVLKCGACLLCCSTSISHPNVIATYKICTIRVGEVPDAGELGGGGDGAVRP